MVHDGERRIVVGTFRNIDLGLFTARIRLGDPPHQFADDAVRLGARFVETFYRYLAPQRVGREPERGAAPVGLGRDGLRRDIALASRHAKAAAVSTLHLYREAGENP